MNLIEKCGGYDKAKQMYEAQLKAGLAPYGYEEALLQYRRENNIFEVGDKVVLDKYNEIFTYTEYSESCDLHFFESEYNYGHAKLKDIRHATPQEIEAGHRL